MNYAIVKNINNCVSQDDTLYCLGDWSFGGMDNIWNFRKQIICKNIYLIPGNHDHHIKNNKVLPNVFEEYNVGFVDIMPIHGHFSQVYAKELFKEVLPQCYKLKVDKSTEIILSHYPIEEWEDMDKGSIHLHGHCHGNINDCETNTIYKRMDIGIDWKEFRPYSIDEIVEIMNKREIKKHASK